MKKKCLLHPCALIIRLSNGDLLFDLMRFFYNIPNDELFNYTILIVAKLSLLGIYKDLIDEI